MSCNKNVSIRVVILILLVLQNITLVAQLDRNAVISVQGASTLMYYYGHGTAGVDRWDGNENIVDLVIPTKIVVDGYKCEVRVIHENAFRFCKKLETAYINVYVIWYYAFWGCDNLKSIEFGPKVNSICEDAFRNCRNVTCIKSHATMPPKCNKYVFDDIPNNITIFVPKDAIERYKSADAWNHFKNFKPL